MGTLALISLGSNLGDRKSILDDAVAALRGKARVAVQAVSSYRETPAVGGPAGQGPFLNAAAALSTDLGPFELLRVLQDVESRAGRVRTVRWGERTLDLDLVYFGDRYIDTGPVFNRVYGGVSTALRVPHPRAAVRRFVLAPLAEISPAFVDPLTGRTIAELLANLDRRPSYVATHDPAGSLGEALCDRLEEFMAPGTEDFSEARFHVLRRGDPIRRAWGHHRDDEPTSTNAWHDLQPIIEGIRRELALGHWSALRRSNRWIASDYWFDALIAWAPRQPQDRAAFRNWFLAVRREILAPTFVVAPHGWAQRLSRLDLDGSWQPPLGDVPVLEVDPDDTKSAAAEVLAACAATRAG